MAYVQVPKDLTKVKTKVMLNLTKRQLICFGLAIVTAGPAYFFTKDVLGTTISAMLLVIIALPFLLFAMYERDGRPLEKILKNIINTKFIRPQVRPYKTENMYALLQKEINEKEGRTVAEPSKKKGYTKRHNNVRERKEVSGKAKAK